MVSFPGVVDSGHKKGVVAGLHTEIRLLESGQVNRPRFIKKPGRVQRNGVGTSALSSEEILGI